MVTAKNHQSFHADLSHTYNDDDVPHGSVLPSWLNRYA